MHTTAKEGRRAEYKCYAAKGRLMETLPTSEKLIKAKELLLDLPFSRIAEDLKATSAKRVETK
jgi:hypothetical protein